jgi:NAD/NADP transhydrogenase beta subunit
VKAINPLQGAMPGHMNVLYGLLGVSRPGLEMEDINAE